MPGRGRIARRRARRATARTAVGAAMSALLALGAALSATSAAATPTAPASPTAHTTRSAAARSAPGSSRAAKPPTVTFGIGAANAKGVDGRSYLDYTVDPGAQLHDHVAIVNIGLKPLIVSVYTVDARNAGSGALGFAPRNAPGADANTWIHVQVPHDAARLELRPRSSTVLPIRIAVPAGASPGDHLAAIIASVTSKARGAGTSSKNIDFEQRIGLRAYFRVSGDVKAALKVDALSADYAGTLNPIGAGRVSVDYTIRNAGNVNLAGRQALVVTGLLGSTGSARVTKQLPLLLPGSSVQLHVVFTGVHPEFLMHARVTVRPIGLQGAVNPQLLPSSAETSFWAVPWALLGGLLVIVAAVFGWLYLRRRRASPAVVHPRPSPARRPMPGRVA